MRCFVDGYVYRVMLYKYVACPYSPTPSSVIRQHKTIERHKRSCDLIESAHCGEELVYI